MAKEQSDDVCADISGIRKIHVKTGWIYSLTNLYHEGGLKYLLAKYKWCHFKLTNHNLLTQQREHRVNFDSHHQE